MAAKPPPPHPDRPRLTEDPQLVEPRVAAALAALVGGEVLDVVEHVLQAHDRRDRHVSGGRHACGDELHHEALLGGTLDADREAPWSVGV